MLGQSQITCPYCWQQIDIILDFSVPEQRYVEDCCVCCRPIVIHYRAIEGELQSLDAFAEGSS